jgi:hypothetical protein
MAEYLGIKVISEDYLLWIVRDALDAALPSDWTILKVGLFSIGWTYLICVCFVHAIKKSSCIYMYIQKHVK